MAKRMQLDFNVAGPSTVDENGQPRPCVMGTEWVNTDTLATLDKIGIAPTDPWGKPLPVSDSRSSDTTAPAGAADQTAQPDTEG